MDIYEEIIKAYEQTESVKKTAELLGTYPIKVRRVLITEGLWRSETSDAVGTLYQEGKTTKEIAEVLCISEKNVQSYLPYTKGMYIKGEGSDDALRSKRYRERNKNAFVSKVSISHSGEPEGKELHEMNEKTILDLDAFREKVSKDAESAAHTSIATKNNPQTPFPYDVVKLRLELVDHFGLGKEERDILHDYGKAEDGIIREVLVPGRMTLHAIHYMIQRLFGWQNSHLHHFELPEQIFHGLTEDSAEEWSKLCGVFFRFPEGDDFSDVYWDDDYDNSQSVKSWLKKKYCDGVWQTYSVGDGYLDNLRKVEDFRGWVDEDKRGKEIFKGRKFSALGLDDLRIIGDIGIDVSHLIERLEIGELLYARGKGGKCSDPKYCREAIAFLIDEMNDEMNDDLLPEEIDDMREAAQRLRDLRLDYQSLERVSYFDPERLRKEVKEDPRQLMTDYRWAIEEMQEICEDYINTWNPEVVQVADELQYEYDYGDGWTVRITCEEGYTSEWEEDNFDYTSASSDEVFSHILSINEEAKFVDSDGQRVSDEMQATLESIFYEQKPICIYADGLNVMDDVGGLGGYLNFLETIHGRDQDEARSMRAWARGMGWTGRRSEPKNML